MFSLSKYSLKPKAWIAPGLLAVLVLMGPVASFAQSDWDVQNRLKRMENEIQTLSRAIYKGETPPAGSLSGGASGADTEVRLQQIETEMRDVRGLVEQQSFEIRQLKNQLERVTGDLELRVGDLEGNGGSASSGATSGASRYTAGSSASRGSLVQPTPAANPGYQWGTNNSEDGSAASSPTSQRLGSYNSSGVGDVASATYDNAFAMVKNRQYKAAQSEFEVFLREHPDHALAGNAKYWLGETHYVRGNFETAARIFAEGYQNHPKGSKAGDNLLKLGLSLDALGKREDACVALKQLKKEDPAGGAPVMRRADQEMSRLGC